MKKLFTNDAFFSAVVIVSVVGEILFCLLKLIAGITLVDGGVYVDSNWLDILLSGIIISACLVTLYISYKNHEKNVMKGMMGAILMAVLFDGVGYITKINLEVDKIVVPLYIIFAAGLFANHFAINKEHHSNPVNVVLNQILAALLAVCNIVWFIVRLASEASVMDAIADAIYAVAFACLAATIVCVESRLDAYRVNREKAGWTEEKGYPEGYVHEHENK